MAGEFFVTIQEDIEKRKAAISALHLHLVILKQQRVPEGSPVAEITTFETDSLAFCRDNAIKADIEAIEGWNSSGVIIALKAMATDAGKEEKTKKTQAIAEKAQKNKERFEALSKNARAIIDDKMPICADKEILTASISSWFSLSEKFYNLGYKPAIANEFLTDAMYDIRMLKSTTAEKNDNTSIKELELIFAKKRELYCALHDCDRVPDNIDSNLEILEGYVINQLGTNLMYY